MKTKIWIVTLVIGFLGLSIFIHFTPPKQQFGFYACECVDSCAVVYEVTSTQLSLEYPTTFCSFLSNQTTTPKRLINSDSNGNFEQYLVEIPLSMFFDPRGSFGYPDSGDQGGYYFSFEILGISRSFIFDTNKGYDPFYFKDISTKIAQKLNEIPKEFSNQK